MPTENRSSNTEQIVSVPREPAQKMQWPEIVALVNSVLGCEAHTFPCERGSIGHEMTGINFNSLARIIDRVRADQADYSAGDMADQGAKAFTARDGEVEQLRAQLADLVSAVRSLNRSPQYEVMAIDDDQPQYRQRKEWVDWILSICDELSVSTSANTTS